jgi:hypothetical protein
MNAIEKFRKDMYRIRDKYGIDYPHDYPTTDISLNEYSNENLDDIFFCEKVICSNYEDYTNDVLEKYARRIVRFLNLFYVEKERPIILLLRHPYRESIRIKKFLEKKYNRNNILLVIGTSETIKNISDPFVTVVDPESSGIFNDITIWQTGIEKVKYAYESQSTAIKYNLRKMSFF